MPKAKTTEPRIQWNMNEWTTVLVMGAKRHRAPGAVVEVPTRVIMLEGEKFLPKDRQRGPQYRIPPKQEALCKKLGIKTKLGTCYVTNHTSSMDGLYALAAKYASRCSPPPEAAPDAPDAPAEVMAAPAPPAPAPMPVDAAIVPTVRPEPVRLIPLVGDLGKGGMTMSIGFAPPPIPHRDVEDLYMVMCEIRDLLAASAPKPKHATAEKAGEQAKKLPRVLLIGTLPRQRDMLASMFSGRCTILNGWHPEDGAAGTMPNCDHVIVNTKFISHAKFDKAKKHPNAEIHYCTGGNTTVQKVLDGLFPLTSKA